MSCGPQSHFSCRTRRRSGIRCAAGSSGGLPPNAPITKATCSSPLAGSRKATIWLGGKSSSGSLARATIVATGVAEAAAIAAGVDRHFGCGRLDQPQRRQQAGEPRQRQRRASAFGHARPRSLRAARSGRDRNRGRDRPAPAPLRGPAIRSADLDRMTGLAASRSLARPQRRRARPADQHSAPRRADRAGRASLRCAFRPTGSVVCADPDRPAGAAARRSPAAIGEDLLTPRARRSAAHGPTAAPSRGTARARGARCAARQGSGEHHIWSSRRPRSLAAQSGAR